MYETPIHSLTNIIFAIVAVVTKLLSSDVWRKNVCTVNNMKYLYSCLETKDQHKIEKKKNKRSIQKRLFDVERHATRKLISTNKKNNK